MRSFCQLSEGSHQGKSAAVPSPGSASASASLRQRPLQSHLCNGASRLTFLKILLFQRTNILTLQQRSKKHGWVNPEYLKVELNNCFPHSWGGGCKKPQVGWHSFGAEMTPRLCKAYIPAVPSFAVIIDHY